MNRGFQLVIRPRKMLTVSPTRFAEVEVSAGRSFSFSTVLCENQPKPGRTAVFAIFRVLFIPLGFCLSARTFYRYHSWVDVVVAASYVLAAASWFVDCSRLSKSIRFNVCIFLPGLCTCVWWVYRYHSWYSWIVMALILLQGAVTVGITAVMRAAFPDAVAPVWSPRWPKYVLLLALGSNREYILGDLEEKYQTIVLPEYGPTLARMWFWTRTIRELASAICGILARLAGLVLLWKKAR